MTPDAARLADIRARLDAVAGLDWMLSSDGGAMFLEAVGDGARRVATFDAHASSDEMRLVADALADRRFLIGLVDRAILASRAASQAAPAGAPPLDLNSGGPRIGSDAPSLPHLAGLRPAAGSITAEGGASDRTPGHVARPVGAAVSAANETRREAKNYSAEAAMKCREPAFKVFLEERHGLARPLSDERAAGRLRSLLGVTSRAELNNGGAALERWKQIRAEFREWQGRER